MSVSYQQVMAAAVAQHVAGAEERNRRSRRIWARLLELKKPMKVTLNNTAPGRIRKDLLEGWAAGMRRHSSWVIGGDHGPAAVTPCPRCAYDPPWRGVLLPLYTDLSGAPLTFDALEDEDVHGLTERHIEQCNGCGLVLAESYFGPGPDEGPPLRRATLHLIEPEA